MKTERKLCAADSAIELADADGNLRHCPICGNSQFKNDAVIKDLHLQSCTECTLGFLNPQPQARQEKSQIASRLDRTGAKTYLDMIAHYRPPAGGNLLVVGSGSGEFQIEAQNRGLNATVIDAGRVPTGEIENEDLPAGSFDVCILSDCLDESRNPAHLLRVVHQLLKPEGILLVTLPILDHWFARSMAYRT